MSWSYVRSYCTVLLRQQLEADTDKAYMQAQKRNSLQHHFVDLHEEECKASCNNANTDSCNTSHKVEASRREETVCQSMQPL